MRAIATLTLLLAFAAPAAAQNAGAPTLKRSATVASEFVRIGDLVENAGVVANIPIFRSPDAGATGSVPVERVLDAIRPHELIGIDPGSITEISVTRLGRPIAGKDIETHIARFFAGQYGLGEAKNLAVVFDREVRTLHVEASATGDLQIARSSYDPRTGHFDVTFELPGSNLARRLTLRYSGILAETLETAVLLRPLARGEVIKRSDFSLERKPKSEIASDAVRADEPIIGLAARQSLRAGQPLRRGDLMKPELVRSNDTVTLVYEAPGILLTLRGKAIESGADGEVITVLNPQSKRTVQGTVSGPGRVTISASLPPQPVAMSIPPATALQESTAAPRRSTQ
jgi:flagellar basal body P-ring formation protein FlgA